MNATFSNRRSMEAFFGTTDLKKINFAKVAKKKLNDEGKAVADRDPNGNIIYRKYQGTDTPIFRMEAVVPKVNPETGEVEDVRKFCAVSKAIAEDLAAGRKSSRPVSIVDVLQDGSDTPVPCLCYTGDLAQISAASFLGI